MAICPGGQVAFSGRVLELRSWVPTSRFGAFGFPKKGALEAEHLPRKRKPGVDQAEAERSSGDPLSPTSPRGGPRGARSSASSSAASRVKVARFCKLQLRSGASGSKAASAASDAMATRNASNAGNAILPMALCQDVWCPLRLRSRRTLRADRAHALFTIITCHHATMLGLTHLHIDVSFAELNG